MGRAEVISGSEEEDDDEEEGGRKADGSRMEPRSGGGSARGVRFS